jgi:hypothetical protein
MNANPPPGWYPDNIGTGQRYWDGQRWTEHTVPRASQERRPAARSGVTPPMAATVTPQRNWFLRHKVLSGVFAFLLLLFVVGALGGENEDLAPAAADTSSEAVDEADAEVSPTSEPEPIDTDADGVIDDEDFRPEDPKVQTRDDVDTDRDGVRDGDDFRPKDPKVQTRDDVDTDKDGVPDYKDDFPKDAKYSKDTDDDGVADQLDDFPKDERYSKDSDGDKVADSEDVFPADPSRSKITAALDNAIGAAESYLDYTAFSRSGLIEQLKYEDYKTEDATFAVDYLKVDWNQQAAKSAKSYLDYTNFSLEGLIGQLQYEGFTYEQATYGANKAY